MKNFIFLASTPYTGSTLFSGLLGSHPDIATISELTGINPGLDPETYPCSCGAYLSECHFYQAVSREFLRKAGKQLSLRDFDVRYYKFNSRLLRNLCFRSLYNDTFEASCCFRSGAATAEHTRHFQSSRDQQRRPPRLPLRWHHPPYLRISRLFA